MIEQHKNLLNWRSTLSTLAISLGIFSIAQSPTRAIPTSSQSSFQLAQVGVRSRIDRPTPLNLRPRNHTPLPRVNRGAGYYRYPGSRHHHYDRYRYGHDHYRTHRRRKRRPRGTVIIINPHSYSEYSNYNSHIRIIRK